MIFAALPPGDTMGAVLAHTMRLSARKVIKKGTVLEQHHIDLMLEAGRASVTVAKLESGDVTEDDAASLIAQALIGEHVETTRASTGRCNLVASSSGVLVYDSHLITSLNLITLMMNLSKNRQVFVILTLEWELNQHFHVHHMTFLIYQKKTLKFHLLKVMLQSLQTHLVV